MRPARRSLTFPRLLPLLLAACSLAGCPDGGEENPAGGTSADVMAPDATAPDVGLPVAPGPAPTHASWCEAGLGGAAGERDFPHDFARAHAGIRLMGPAAAWLAWDAHLVDVLEADAELTEALLADYAEGFDTVCALTASEPTEEPGLMIWTDTWVQMTPNAAFEGFPDTIDQVIVDLTDPRHMDGVEVVVGEALATPVTIGHMEQRRFLSFPEQSDGWTHYESNLTSRPSVVAATGTRDLAITFLIGPRLSPEAARIAGGLRLAGRATLVGWDVHTAVAESTWSGAGGQGLLWRRGLLSYMGAPWPDVIPADVSSDMPAESVDKSQGLSLSPLPSGPITRAAMATYDRAAGLHDPALSRGAMRAALLIAWGTLDWFFPYFDLVGRGIDQALLDGLAEVSDLQDGDRQEMVKSLGRFMHHLHDGHAFYWDESDAAFAHWPDGYLAVQIQQIDGEAVIRQSAHDSLDAGDTIIGIDGVEAAEWYAEAMSRQSASSQGYRFVLATDELKAVHGSRELALRDPAGDERVEVVGPASWEVSDSLPWGGTLRPTGWLDALGEAGVYYVNMSGAVTTDVSDAMAEIAQISDAKGVILDMRDYPDLDIYGFAGSFNPAPYSAPIFQFPTWAGPDSYSLEEEVWEFLPVASVYTGPIVLMVSHKSVSAAECFSQMVAPLPNVTVVGQQSASTNGTITSAYLPGQLHMYWTGMRLLNPDYTEFHGIGIVPDVEVTPTAQDFAAGLDPELNAALATLN